MEHTPVLVDAIVELLGPPLSGGGIVVDATLGRAGHALRLLTISPEIELIGIDRDLEALEASRTVLSAHQERVRLVRDDFQNVSSVLERLGVAEVCGVLFDLGVSSPQLDDRARGFSFRSDGPLDMRMDTGQSLSASGVVNHYSAGELERVIGRYGEERFARRIARAIVRARPIRSTVALAEIVKSAIPAATRRTGGHPARRTFQGIRIEVNRELDALEIALPDAIEALSTGGRAVVVSYHSLEDRIVKQTFKEQSGDCTCPPDFPQCRCGAHARVRVLTKRPTRPTQLEIDRNPRSGAAKLRALERLAPVPGERRAP